MTAVGGWWELETRKGGSFGVRTSTVSVRLCQLPFGTEKLG